MRYNQFRYIYPCRPSNAIPQNDINYWDNTNNMLSQLKMNGSNTIIFTNGDILRVMGRHNQLLSNFQLSKEEIIENIYKPLNLNGNWLVLNGEYLNKSKRDENGLIFNHKLILFDILVYNSDYLIGKTFEERVNILDSIYGQNSSDKEYLYGISENIYRVKSYTNNFDEIFNKYTSIDMIEGLVFKRRNAKLEIGNTENNNTKSQVKCRKSTKLYRY